MRCECFDFLIIIAFDYCVWYNINFQLFQICSMPYYTYQQKNVKNVPEPSKAYVSYETKKASFLHTNYFKIYIVDQGSNTKSIV